MARIGFLGLGNMGRGMAQRLAAAGHEVTVYNRTAGKAEGLVGVRRAGTPREAAEGADAVFAMVGDDAASRVVWLGDDGALAGNMAADITVIECSTVSYEWAKELAGTAGGQGRRYVDCPVTGLPDAAAAGELVLLVGAEDADLAAVRPLLAPLSREIIHFGGVGCGTAYKLMVNLIGAIQIASMAEGMVIAEEAGLDLSKVAYALGIGQAAAPQVVRSVGRFLADDHEQNVVFTGSLRAKDAGYGVAMAENLGVAPAFGQLALDMFGRLRDLGLETQNETSVIRAVERTGRG